MRSRKVTFLDTILRDAGIGVRDLLVVMAGRVVWKEIVQGLQGVSAEAKG